MKILAKNDTFTPYRSEAEYWIARPMTDVFDGRNKGHTQRKQALMS